MPETLLSRRLVHQTVATTVAHDINKKFPVRRRFYPYALHFFPFKKERGRSPLETLWEYTTLISLCKVRHGEFRSKFPVRRRFYPYALHFFPFKKERGRSPLETLWEYTTLISLCKVRHGEFSP